MRKKRLSVFGMKKKQKKKFSKKTEKLQSDSFFTAKNIDETKTCLVIAARLLKNDRSK